MIIITFFITDNLSRNKLSHQLIYFYVYISLLFLVSVNNCTVVKDPCSRWSHQYILFTPNFYYLRTVCRSIIEEVYSFIEWTWCVRLSTLKCHGCRHCTCWCIGYYSKQPLLLQDWRAICCSQLKTVHTRTIVIWNLIGHSYQLNLASNLLSYKIYLVL